MLTETAAAELGVGRQSISRVRIMLSLLLYEHLKVPDQLHVFEALRMVRDTDQTKKAFDTIRGLANRVFGPVSKRRPGPPIDLAMTRIDKFHAAMHRLIDTCDLANQIPVPYLSNKQADEAAEELRRAVHKLHALRRRIEEEKT
jgi:hypothetical protein